jgi:hypothetical protein
LGSTLASWMVAGGRPLLPEATRGVMLPLLAVTEPTLLALGLASGFMLPLVWRQDASHDMRLPTRLLGCADEVLQVVGTALRRELRWGLALGPGLDADLSGLDAEMTWGSAWTTLAAGLFVAASGGQPDLRVFSTAAYDAEYVEARGVRGIAEKLDAIARIERGSQQGCAVFVAAANAEEAREVVAERGWAWLKVEVYPVRSSMDDQGWSVRTLLQSHLDLLATPPEDGARLVQWVNEATLSFARRERYYLDVVETLSARLGEVSGGRFARGETLMVAAGDRGFNQAALLALTLRPSRLIVTYQGPKSEEQAGRLLGWLEGRADWQDVWTCIVEITEPPTGGVVAALVEALGAEQRAVVDVTGGTRAMLWAMMEAGRRVGAQITYISHRTPGRATYGEERLLVYDEVVGLGREVE